MYQKFWMRSTPVGPKTFPSQNLRINKENSFRTMFFLHTISKAGNVNWPFEVFFEFWACATNQKPNVT